MADLVRFKDIYQNEEALSFKDMYTTEYRPGEDELVNYRAYRRKRTIGVGEGGPVGESTNFEEEMSKRKMSKRELSLKRARDFKRNAPKRKIGRERAKRKMADVKKLRKWANKQSRNNYFLKLSKGVPRSEMPFAQRDAIDKKLESPIAIAKMKRDARKMFPEIRKKEMQRKKG